jgi:hypothetical protein
MLTHNNKITYLYATSDASVEEFYRLKIENTNFKFTFNLKLQAFIKEALTNNRS